MRERRQGRLGKLSLSSARLVLACVVAAVWPWPCRAEAALEVSVSDAVLMALEHNHELAVERVRPEIVRTLEDEELHHFDPVLRIDGLGWEGVEGEKLRGPGILERFDTSSTVGRLALESRLPTGTGVAIEAETDVVDEATNQQLVQSRVGFTVSQALLQDFGPRATLARVREARIDTEISAHELRGFAEALVAEVEQTYWEYALHRREVEILGEAVAVAERLRVDTDERVGAGTLGRVELAAARSEVALRKQEWIDARSDAEKSRLRLLRLMNPGGPDAWTREVRPREDLAPPAGALDEVGDHVAVAERMRPELNQARLLVERGEVQVVRTKNGLLPRMDLFVRLGRSGYASSFGESWKQLDEDDLKDVRAGLSLEFPLGRRSARASYRRAVLERGQAESALANLRQLVELDVRTAHVEVARARELSVVAAETRSLDEEKLSAEWDKHHLGRSSAFQVARALRDLARSRLAEAEAFADSQRALVELYRLDGSLLARRGITTFAEPPVKP